MGHCSSRFFTVIVYLMRLVNLDDDMETNDAIIRRIINLGRMCEEEEEEEEEVVDLTFCNLSVQNCFTEGADDMSQGGDISLCVY